MEKTLYERLGGYDAITAVINDLMIRLLSDVTQDVLAFVESTRADMVEVHDMVEA